MIDHENSRIFGRVSPIITPSQTAETKPKRQEELPVIDAAYELAKWTLMRAGKLPKHLRAGLGRRLEDRTQELLELLIMTKYQKSGKAALLREANVKLEAYRFLVRLARDTENGFTEAMYLSAATLIVKVGTQVGNWLKTVEKMEAAK